MRSQSSAVGGRSSTKGVSPAAGFRAGAVAALLQQALSIVATIALAHILTPRDFGLVAIALVVTGVAELLASVGLAVTVVRNDRYDARLFSTLFWLSALLALTVCGLLVGGSGAFARLVGLPAAAALIAVFGVATAFTILGQVPRGILLREGRLSGLYAAEGSSAALYFVAEVGFALAGFGAVSVPLGLLLSNVVLAVWLFSTCGWRPSLIFDRQSVRTHARFNVESWGSTIASFLSGNVDYWFTGRFLGASSLGFYYIAFVMPSIVRQRLTNLSYTVLLPRYARLQRDRGELRLLFQRSYALHVFVGWPLMTMLAISGEDLIGMAFGTRWESAAAALPALSAAAALDFAIQSGTGVNLALGRPNRNTAVDVARLCALLGCLSYVIASDDRAIRAIGLSVLVATAVAGTTAWIALSRLLSLPLRALILPLVTPTLGVLVMIPVGLALAGLTAHWPAAWRVLVVSLVSCLGYVGAAWVVNRKALAALVRDALTIALPRHVRPPFGRSRGTNA